jgi:acetyl esterase/lipase
MEIVINVLIGLGVIIVIILLYLVVIIFFPILSVSKQPIQKSKQPEKEDIKPPKCRRDVAFKVGETALNAWLYLPENLSTPIPCIIMSHGLGGTKDMLLESYALHFVEAGMAVLTYDYRHFGASEGEPRQLYSIACQLEDLKAAIKYARGRNEIDPDKIALWGTSAAGGYGLMIAARDKKIACIVGQCPALDNREDVKLALKREGIRFFLHLFMHAQRDKGRSRFGLSAHKIPIVGKPGTLAMIVAPGAFEGYSKLVSLCFKNEICARILLMSRGYNPIDYVKDVQCPVLLQVCEQDNLVSEKSHKRIAEILGKYAEVKEYPIGHFDIYEGENFKKAVNDQIMFFKKQF